MFPVTSIPLLKSVLPEKVVKGLVTVSEISAFITRVSWDSIVIPPSVPEM